MSRVSEVFSRLNKGEGALIAYTMAGDPDIRTSEQIVECISRSGADLIELGMPFSDPIADGPTIQQASNRALMAGTRLRDVIELAKRVRKKTDIPLAMMTYYNIAYARGLKNFLSMIQGSFDAVIIPDLPAEEGGELKEEALRYSIDTVFLASPTTSMKRLRLIDNMSTGFVYLVSVLGVTGARESISEETAKTVRRVVKCVKKPVAVGFGLSKPEHVREVLSLGAKGAVVGSAIVKIIERNIQNKRSMIEELRNYVKTLALACHSNSYDKSCKLS